MSGSDRAAAYDLLFAEYRALHDHFGRDTAAMHRLRDLRRRGLAKNWNTF